MIATKAAAHRCGGIDRTRLIDCAQTAGGTRRRRTFAAL